MKTLSIMVIAIGVAFTSLSCKEKAKEVKVETETIVKEVEKKIENVFSFSKEVKSGNYSFNVKATNEGSLNKLMIQPVGFDQNDLISTEIDGTVTGVESEDLNGDGLPEILVYVNSAGSGAYGTVICYSSNNSKSMTPVSFPETASNPKLSKGYMGHDEFSVVEGNLSQRFPIYKEEDTNASPTGKTKQVQYQLKDGEASRVFVIKKVSEY